jgi:alanine racemase
MKTKHLLSWIELSESALDNNIKSLVRLAGKRKLAVSVKANAYGHGLSEIVTLLMDRPEIAYLTVHSLEEAIACRVAGWERRIMLLGPVPLCELEAVLVYNLEPVIFTREALNELGLISNRRKTTLRTHLKLETGTNRQGLTEKELSPIATIYRKFPHLKKPYGASMHFANIEDTTNHEYAQQQLDRFVKMLRKMAELGIKPTIRHTACSAALILFDKTRFELVRPGIALYGHWPSKETYLSYRLAGGANDIFQPVLGWKTRITQIKNVPPDSFVGYGCTFRTTTRTRLAVLPIGYSDGYDRSLSNLAYVLVRGKRAPVRGRICMNLTMVDITDIPGARLEDPVTLIGRQKSEKIGAEQLASWSGSISYEVLARLSAHLPRLVARN